MTVLKTILLSVMLTLTSAAVAEGSAEQEAEKLLQIINFDRLMTETVKTLLDAEIQQNPDVEPLRDVMLRFFGKYFSLSAIGPAMIELYTANFTAAELREINAFYRTKAGKKTIEVMPVLVEQGAELAAQLVEENMDELEAMILEEMVRVRRSGE